MIRHNVPTHTATYIYQNTGIPVHSHKNFSLFLLSKILFYYFRKKYMFYILAYVLKNHYNFSLNISDFIFPADLIKLKL